MDNSTIFFVIFVLLTFSFIHFLYSCLYIGVMRISVPNMIILDTQLYL